ncbi:hypothetical protein P280DRAFT_424411 [Massarina eburnea CBS 473.64]|uniref:SnoaL-like domain-containing protein n=1 Tax=Massarina eburnea CBS 473.64 TaxID=1395130 RepID=A0A6A6S406_9PLEO|nr:hypothetical protein P280DRAFT_424411 [Massarina eburnea CBS 473.64]
MYAPTLLTTLLLPIGLLALPSSIHAVQSLDPRQAQPAKPSLNLRQSQPTKPSPCVRISPAPDANATETRFDGFAKAFIYEKNITEAFTYIAKDYINHNPAAQNGSDSAWGILSPIWASQNITPIRTTFDAESNQGWLNYQTGSFGEVVDRFRWEAGCIAEHWDQGETYPEST